jgi:peroxiredoxin
VPVSAEGRSKSWLRPALLVVVIGVVIASYSNHWLSRSGPIVQPERREALPDFTYRQANGEQWRLKEHRGQVILLNFWATWCPPCREETPGLVQIQHEFGNRGFTVAGVAMDENPETVPGFVERFQITYPILLPPPSEALANSVESLPTSLLIDKRGRVARAYVGAISPSVFAADIRRLLQEKAAHG